VRLEGRSQKPERTIKLDWLGISDEDDSIVNAWRLRRVILKQSAISERREGDWL